MNNDIRDQVSRKYMRYLELKRQLVKYLRVDVGIGPVIHPYYLNQTYEKTKYYKLHDIIRGCLCAPVNVAEGYLTIVTERYNAIRPRPCLAELMSMVYGVMWSSCALELLKTAELPIPVPRHWHDYISTDEYEIETGDIPEYVIEMYNFDLTCQWLLIGTNCEWTPIEQHICQRAILELVLYHGVSLEIESISTAIKIILCHMFFDRLPHKWYKSKIHAQFVQMIIDIRDPDWFDVYPLTERGSGDNCNSSHTERLFRRKSTNARMALMHLDCMLGL